LVTDTARATLAALTNGCGALHGHAVTNPPDAASIACTVSATAFGDGPPDADVDTHDRPRGDTGAARARVELPLRRDRLEPPDRPGRERAEQVDDDVRGDVREHAEGAVGRDGTSAEPPTTEFTSGCTVAVSGRSIHRGTPSRTRSPATRRWSR
jgi:hypothetical protein